MQQAPKGALILFCAALASWGDVDLGERTVTTPLDPVGAAVLRLDRSLLDAHPGDLGSLLDGLPGVDVRRLGGIGAPAFAEVRGSPSGQVDVRLDGIPLGGAGFRRVDLGPLALEGLERVEVRPAGLAGSRPGINLVSRRAKAPLSAGIRAGSFGHRAASVAIGQGRWQVAAFGETARNDAPWHWDRGTPAHSGDDTLVRLPDDRFSSAGLQFLVKPSERWNLHSRLDASRRRLASLSQPDAGARLERSSAQIGADLDLERARFDVSARSAWGRWTDPLSRLHHASGKGSWSQDLALRAAATAFGDCQRVMRPSVGGEIAWEDARRRSLGALAAAIEPGAVRWTGGLRTALEVGPVDRTRGVSAEIGAWRSHTRSDAVDGGVLQAIAAGPVQVMVHNRFDAALRAHLMPARDWRLWGSAAAWQRSPSFGELLGDDGGTLANPGLRAESSRQIEAGASWTTESFRVVSSIWLSQFEDPIEYRVLGGSPLGVHEQGAGHRSAGIEAQTRATLRGATARAHASWTRSWIQDDNPALDGREKRHTPRLKAGIDLSTPRWRGLRVGADAAWRGAVWTNELNLPADRVPGFALFGAWIEWEHHGLSVRLTGANLGDHRFEDWTDRPLAGRTVETRISWVLPPSTTARRTDSGNNKGVVP